MKKIIMFGLLIGGCVVLQGMELEIYYEPLFAACRNGEIDAVDKFFLDTPSADVNWRNAEVG